nr:hypothetical protein [Tanacetum cinerariifolium]
MDQDSAYMVDTSKVPMFKPENGNAPPITQVVEGVETIIPPATTEKMTQRRLELKAKSTLLMGIPNKHQLKFNFIEDAKSLLQAVEKRFGGNAATKKTQRNLLKQQYENFTASSSEMNKPEIDTLSLDNLYNNLKIYEPEVKGTSSSNTNTNIQNVAFVSSNNTNNTNEAVNTAHGVTTASTQATAVNSTTINNLSDAMAMLTMRAMRFLKNTGRKFTMNGNETIGFDKSKVECYNCHKRGHFARECKAPRSQDTKHKESTRRTMPVETPASSALVSCDRLGGNFLPPKPDLFGLEDFMNKSKVSEPTVKKPIVETSDAKASADKPKLERKNLVLLKSGIINTARLNFSKTTISVNTARQGNSQQDLQDKGVIDSGCSRHMIRNMSYLTNYEEIDRGYVAFRGTTTCDDVESKSSQDDGFQPSSDDGKKVDETPRQQSECKDQKKEDNVNNTNNVNAAGINEVNVVGININNELTFDPEMHALEDISTFNFSSDQEDADEEADMNNMDTTIQVSSTPTTRIHKDHPLDQVIRDLHSNTQTRNMSKNLEDHGIEAIRLFLAYDSFKDFVVYQMDVKSAFLYGKIEEEVYVCQPLGFEDLDFPDKVYKVEKELYGLHQAPRAWHKDDILLVQVYVDDIIFGLTKKELCNAFEKMMHEKFQMSFMGELTFFLGFFLQVKNASTSMETQKPLLKDEDGEEVDAHIAKKIVVANSITEAEYVAASSCYRQATVKAKTVNGKGQLQALVDGKKVIITESTIRRYLQLEDAEGVDCLPNVIIFKQLTLM